MNGGMVAALLPSAAGQEESLQKLHILRQTLNELNERFTVQVRMRSAKYPLGPLGRGQALARAILTPPPSAPRLSQSNSAGRRGENVHIHPHEPHLRAPRCACDVPGALQPWDAKGARHGHRGHQPPARHPGTRQLDSSTYVQHAVPTTTYRIIEMRARCTLSSTRSTHPYHLLFYRRA